MARRPSPNRPTPSNGISVDAAGNRAFDPSENVKALNEAANKRQDDLREANNRLMQAKLDGLDDLVKLRAQHDDAVRAAESRRVNEQLTLRSYYEERLGQAEAKRIDAIRAVDVNAVAVASQRASDQATVLATQVAQSAEALRGLVASTANTNAQAQQTANTTLSTRITTLEQAQYEGKGKQSFADPQMAELMAEMKLMRGTKSEGISATWGVVAVIITIIVAATGIFLANNRAPSVMPLAPITVPIKPQ